MKKENKKELEPSKNLGLEDIISLKNEYLISILKIKLEKRFQEKLWLLARDTIKGKGKIEKWTKLSKIIKQSENSLLRIAERSRAKPIIVYIRLLRFLEKRGIKIKLKGIEKNIIQVVREKNKIKNKLPITLIELGLGKIEQIKIRIPKKSWEEISKNPKITFQLKDFILKLKIKNPYWKSKRKKHKIFKKIGKNYEIDFTKKVYVHLGDRTKKELFDKFYYKIPGISKRVKQKNACKLLDYYSSYRSLETISNRHNYGMPLLVILKIIKYINQKNCTINWIGKNLVGLSSGERTYYKIRLPINWKSKEGILFLTSLLGDGGLGFRSSLWAWAVPHYSQFRHKELLTKYVKNIKKIFGLSIKKQEKIELPAICGYMVVASGYFIPGHKSYTNPNLPKIIKDLKFLITSLNWLISDDGTFTVNHFSIAGGCYHLNKNPLRYMLRLKELINKELPNIKITFRLNKDSTYNMGLKGGFYVMKELNKLFKTYNYGVFAIKKQKLLENYLNNRYYSIKEYKKRYRRYVRL